MKNSLMKRRTVILVTVVALALAACGTESAGSQATSTPTSESSTPTATDMPPTATSTPLYQPPATATPDPNHERLRMVSARNRWEARNLQSYEFDFRWTCWCFFASQDTVRIRVDDGEITSVTNPATGEPVAEPEYESNRYMTVDELFDWVEGQIEIPSEKLTVEYADDYNYPLNADSDPAIIVDDERSFVISDFRPYPDGADLEAARAQLAEARMLWAGAGYEDYAYEFKWDCFFCPPESRAIVRIEIRDGRLASVIEADTGEPYESNTGFPYVTVEGIFEWIDQKLALEPELVELEFDPETGFPNRVRLDIGVDQSIDELSFSATGLKRLVTAP